MATLAPGSKLGHYEILAQIGAGGMGEVYRAKDSRLGREVAIKILPEGFSKDPGRVARFEREARVLASLNNPHIAIIHDFRRADVSYLVMELLEGETLADRIARGSVSVKQALQIGRQIAVGLEAAHERGIIHRDLKPANIKLLPDDTVKILDFGLAKTTEERVELFSPSLPTIPLTCDGRIFGTMPYMSPEQLRGQAVDRRTDIWAFGCVLFEMLSGHLAFGKDTITETIGKILEREPDWDWISAPLPATVSQLLKQCLKKDVRQRLQHIGDARIQIDDVLLGADPPEVIAKPVQRYSRNAAALMTLAAVCIFGAGLIAAMYFRASAPEPRLIKLSLQLPENVPMPVHFAVSPDGSKVVLSGEAGGKTFLWLRSLDSLESQMIQGTDGAQWPFWSPDSRSIAFFAGGKLKRIDLAGGAVRSLADVLSDVRGGSWSSKGVIVFTVDASSGLYQVSSVGGPATPITELDRTRDETSHRWPSFLPDGEHFLYYARSRQVENNGIYVGSLMSKESNRKLLLPAISNATYTRPSHILFARGGTLLRQRFNLNRLELEGDPVTIAEGVAYSIAPVRAHFSVADDGVLVYLNDSGTSDDLQYAWFDRAGQRLPTVGPTGVDPSSAPAIAPDQLHLAAAFIDPKTGTSDIWLHDLLHDSRTRFTFDPLYEEHPVWAPDSRRVGFISYPLGKPSINIKNVSGTGNDEQIPSPDVSMLTDWSLDGRFIAVEKQSMQTKSDIGIVQMMDQRKIFSFLATPFLETQGQFSPDGRFMAYTSDESGQFEVYLVKFPSGDGKIKISTNGGQASRWRSDGKELFYLSPDGKLISVSLNPMAQPKASSVLFQTSVRRDSALTTFVPYAVSADGQRFLIAVPTKQPPSPSLTVFLHWASELTK